MILEWLIPGWRKEGERLKRDISHYKREEKRRQESLGEEYRFRHPDALGAFKKSPWAADHLCIQWYRCPSCGTEFNTSPPSFNWSSMERECPDCRYARKHDGP